ncbi:MAG TPA: SPFH domain-containing protein [Candidatus Heimdallarchaeota archaeon]|nr:SPFH domain-containing protein [Candidatus Heimdallarchaeota archaeon]
MMDFFGRLLEYIERLWPFRPVEAWERGFYIVFSKPMKEVGQGIWPVIPYFTDVLVVPIAEARLTTPMLNIVLQNGKRLAFSVSARVKVVDVKKALIVVSTYQETTGEEVAAFIADFLADAKPDRLTSAIRRKNLIIEAVRELNNRTIEYGVEVIEIQFTNWIEDIKTYRLLNDSSLSPPSLTW